MRALKIVKVEIDFCFPVGHFSVLKGHSFRHSLCTSFAVCKSNLIIRSITNKRLCRRHCYNRLPIIKNYVLSRVGATICMVTLKLIVRGAKYLARWCRCNLKIEVDLDRNCKREPEKLGRHIASFGQLLVCEVVNVQYIPSLRIVSYWGGSLELSKQSYPQVETSSSNLEFCSRMCAIKFKFSHINTFRPESRKTFSCDPCQLPAASKIRFLEVFSSSSETFLSTGASNRTATKWRKESGTRTATLPYQTTMRQVRR